MFSTMVTGVCRLASCVLVNGIPKECGHTCISDLRFCCGALTLHREKTMACVGRAARNGFRFSARSFGGTKGAGVRSLKSRLGGRSHVDQPWILAVTSCSICSGATRVCNMWGLFTVYPTFSSSPQFRLSHSIVQCMR